MHLIAASLNNYPDILTPKHIEKILHTSPVVTSEIMQNGEFPLMAIGELKLAYKPHVVLWLKNKRDSSATG